MLGGLVGDKWYNLANTIPLSANITTKDLIGTLLWYLAYIPLVLVAPERLQRPFIVCSSAFGLTLIGLLAWSVSTQGGGGPLFHTVNTSTSTPYSMMLGITSILSRCVLTRLLVMLKIVLTTLPISSSWGCKFHLSETETN